MGRDGLIKRLKHFCHSFFRYYSASTRAFTFNLSLPAFHLSSGRGASYWGERPSNTQSSSKASREWSGTVIFPGRSRFNPWPRLELNGASSVTESRFPGWKRGGGGTIQGGNERPNRPTFPRTNQLCFPSSLLPLKNPLPVQDTIACNGKKDEILFLFERGSEREGFFYFSFRTIDWKSVMVVSIVRDFDETRTHLRCNLSLPSQISLAWKIKPWRSVGVLFIAGTVRPLWSCKLSRLLRLRSSHVDVEDREIVGKSWMKIGSSSSLSLSPNYTACFLINCSKSKRKE